MEVSNLMVLIELMAMILVKLHGWIVILTIHQIENEQIDFCSSEDR